MDNSIYFYNRAVKGTGKITLLDNCFQKKTFVLDKIEISTENNNVVFIHSKDEQLEKYVKHNSLAIVDNTNFRLVVNKNFPGIELNLYGYDKKEDNKPLQLPYNIIYFEKHYEEISSQGFQKDYLKKQIAEIKVARSQTKNSKK